MSLLSTLTNDHAILTFVVVDALSVGCQVLYLLQGKLYDLNWMRTGGKSLDDSSLDHHIEAHTEPPTPWRGLFQVDELWHLKYLFH
jgi:hypothetical protein